MTGFCRAEIPLWDGLSFFVDGNSKITASNGSYAEPEPNAFSLPHIATCPGSTGRCRESCYVHGLKKHAPEVYRTYELNEMALHCVLEHSEMARLAAGTLGTWIMAHASGGFRWHVSGDIFSFEYARWIALVCGISEEVQHWIYTRTLSAVPYLSRVRNLALNVSVDRHNLNRALETAKRWHARVCYLVSAPDEIIPDLPEGSVIFPDYPLRGRSLPIATEHAWWQALTIEQKRMVCPADFFGQSEQHRCGPCSKCLDVTTKGLQ